MRTRRTPCLSLTKQRNWIRTSSRRGSPARPLLRGCQSLREEPLSQSVPPLVELKIDQSQRTELYPASRTAAGAKLSQQGVIPVGCSATSVAHCLGVPSATLNARTLTRVIPNRPTTVSRARLVSGRLLFVKSWIFRGNGFISSIAGTLGSSLPLRLPTSESVSTLPFFSVQSTTLCFQDPAASLKTSRRAENPGSQPVSATPICAMPTTEVQLSLMRETGERCRGSSHKGSKTGAKTRQLERSKETKFRGTTYRRTISKEMRSRERRAHRMTSEETRSRGMKLGRMKSQDRSRHVVNQ